jgi:hypothetical protein
MYKPKSITSFLVTISAAFVLCIVYVATLAATNRVERYQPPVVEVKMLNITTIDWSPLGIDLARLSNFPLRPGGYPIGNWAIYAFVFGFLVIVYALPGTPRPSTK